VAPGDTVFIRNKTQPRRNRCWPHCVASRGEPNGNTQPQGPGEKARARPWHPAAKQQEVTPGATAGLSSSAVHGLGLNGASLVLGAT